MLHITFWLYSLLCETQKKAKAETLCGACFIQIKNLGSSHPYYKSQQTKDYCRWKSFHNNSPCALNVRRCHILDIFSVINGKRMIVSIAFSIKKHLQTMCRQYCCSIPIGNYQTVEIHWLSACSRENTANNGPTTLCCKVSCHSRWWMYHLLSVYYMTQGL